MSDTTTQEGDADTGAASSDTIEARAGRMGWVPRERFRGDASRWVTAEEYVERGERMLPVLQERNRSLDRTVADLQRQHGETTTMLANLVQSTRKAEQIGYRRALRELEARREAAIDAGDKDAVRAADREIKELGAEPVVPEVKPQNKAAAEAIDPATRAFLARNPWMNTDPSARNYAIAELDKVKVDFPDDTLAEQLEEVEARMREDLPKLFANSPARRRANGGGEVVEPEGRRRPAAALVAPSGAAAPRNPGPRSFEALPAEAKREYERQAKMLEGKGDPFTKEEYARYYWEGEQE